MNYELAVSNIRSELKTYIQKNNIKSLVIGISGGIDSCLCAALAKPVCDELKIPLIGRSLPMKGNKWEEIERAQQTGKFCTNFKEENLNDLFLPMQQKLNPIFTDGIKHKISLGNMKARLRMIYLYDIAYKMSGMVLSTDNYTEYMLGFWTKFGDEGDFSMIQFLWKTEVYEMAEWIAKNECKTLEESTIILKTIDALATDGLGISNKGDLGQIMPEFEGSSKEGYEQVDKILKNFLLLKNEAAMTPQVIKAIDKMLKHPVIQRHLNSQFKRDWPITLKREQIFN